MVVAGNLKLRTNKLPLGGSVASWARVEIYRLEVKVKVTLEQVTKAQKWSRGIVLLLL